MHDKEMLDWVDKFKPVFSQIPLKPFTMDYIDESGQHQLVEGTSLRDCIQKANTVEILEGELHFLHKGIEMKAVLASPGQCKGCDMLPVDRTPANNSLQDKHGFRCGISYQIMFVNSKDKEEYED